MSTKPPLDALVRFEPSGRVAKRFVLVAVLGVTAAAALGVGYQRLLEVSPFVVLHVLAPFVLGGVLGLLAILCSRLGHVRNGRVVVAFSVASATVALGAAWWLYVPDPETPASFRSLWPVAWFLEICFAVGLAVWLPWAWWRRAVYCEEEERFLPRELLGKAWGCELLTLRRAAGADGVEALLGLGLRPMPANDIEGEFRFWLRRGRSGQWLTVWWHGQLESPRGRKLRRDVLVLRRVAVEDDFVERLTRSLSVA